MDRAAPRLAGPNTAAAILGERRPAPPWVTHEQPVDPVVPESVALQRVGKDGRKLDKDGDPIGMFFVDESRKPQPPQKEAYISIEVRCETQPEERVAISGSDWQLGSWNPKESWYLNTSPETYPLWRDRIPMPSPGGQFKVFIKNTVGDFVWEPLPCNRTWPRAGLAPDAQVRLVFGESGISTLTMGRSREKPVEVPEEPKRTSKYETYAKPAEAADAPFTYKTYMAYP
ncbi:CPK3 [Symbiodinium natans]|uniref:CPK3 protein n=1 Tax=Symbiodinium natans TaxID=878477 RepID=A0A812J4D2_9DINO|nr:CPK3 [Symbiodinium natans]